MDTFDQKILACLSRDARQSNAEIARRVGLSRSAVSERIRRLEQQQHILGYRAELRSPMESIGAFFQLSFQQPCCDELADTLRSWSEVRSFHSVTGDVDAIVYAEAASMADLNELRSRLEQLPRLTRILTHTVLEERIRR